MNKFKRSGLEYWFAIRAKNRKLTLNWTKTELLKKYVAKQSPLGAKRYQVSQQLTEAFDLYVKDDLAHSLKTGLNYQMDAAFFYWLQWVHEDRFNAVLESIENLKEITSVIDIGSGVAIFDLILSQLLPNTKFTLLDKTTDANFIEEKFVQIDYHGNYPFYNNWEIVEDCINASNLNRNNFNFIGPNDPWPETDLIVSSWSWCWHYPKETYWDKAIASLRPNGQLVLDVLYKKDVDIIKEISDAMNCQPVVISRHPVIQEHPWRHSWHEIDGFYGGLYKWTNKSQ